MLIRKLQNFRRKTSMNTAELHIHEAGIYAAGLCSDAKRIGRNDAYQAVANLIGGCSRSKIYSLVHRPRSLKSIASHIREGLALRYAEMRERQQKAFDHEIRIAKAIGASSAALRAAADLAGRDFPEAEAETSAP